MTKSFNENEKGFALITVLVVMVILSILFLAVINLTDNNTKQLDMQEDHMRAYYLSKSGIDIAYAALMLDNKKGVKNIVNLIDGRTAKLDSTLILPNATNPLGTVTINVKLVDQEVRISAFTQLENSASTALLVLYVNKDDFNKTRWERE